MSAVMKLTAALLALPLLLPPAPALADPLSGLVSGGAPAVSTSSVTVCHGFGCHYRQVVRLTAADHAQIGRIMGRGRASPQAERAAIAEAVAWFERRVAPAAGTGKDTAKSTPGQSRTRGQLDCIDETVNTTRFLQLVEARGLLRHHSVARVASRGFFLDGRYPHASAVVAEKVGGARWTVDSWPGPGGAKPEIMALQVWHTKGGR